MTFLLPWLPRILGAISIITALSGAVLWLRADAVEDELRRLAIQRLENTNVHEAAKSRIREEINNADADELRRRALDHGMFIDERE